MPSTSNVLEGNAVVENLLKTQRDRNQLELFLLCVAGWRNKHIVAKGRWNYIQDPSQSGPRLCHICLLLNSVSTPIYCNCSMVLVSITLLGIYIHKIFHMGVVCEGLFTSILFTRG